MGRAAALLLGLLLASQAHAQSFPGMPGPAPEPEPEPAVEPAPAPKPITMGSIPTEAARLEESLREIRARSGMPGTIQDIQARIPIYQAEVGRNFEATRSRIDAPGAVAEARDLRASWSRFLDRIGRHGREVEGYSARLDADLATLGEYATRWAEARASLPADAPATVRTRTDEAIASIDGVHTELTTLRTQVFEIDVSLGELEETAGSLQEQLDSALRQRAFSQDSAPIWRLADDPAGRVEWRQALADSWASNVQTGRSYVQAEAARIVFQMVIVLGAAALFWRARKLPPSERPRVADTSWGTLLDRPISSAIVLGLGLGTVLHARAPAAYVDIVMVVGAVPLVRVLRSLVPGDTPRSGLVLVGTYIANRLVPLLAGAELVFRFALIIVNVVTLFGSMWSSRRLGALPPVEGSPSPRALRWLAGGAACVLALALAANLLGMVSLSTMLVDGSIEALYVAVVLWTSIVLVGGVVRLVLAWPIAHRSGMVRNHERAIDFRVRRFFRWVGAVSWVLYVLFLFNALEPVVRGLRAVFGASATVGNVTLSLGGVVAFVFTGWLGWQIARGMRFALDEDVLPRLQLPKGVPDAVSKLSSYVMLTLAFFVALSAAGIELSQFAFMAGALGVGIGFGLTTVVNNFVSGLILLFERPIKEGDVIEVGTLTGTVVHIGIRACSVRTFDGAEVIVPNANLISNQVVNWTLSDRVRRFDLIVGAAYGTEPERVLAILDEAVRGTPGVLTAPKPFITFDAFGVSSLDFKVRAWAPYDEYNQIRSDMAIRVEKALREAGIEIPFPQQDLHLRTIAPEAAAALRSDRVAAVDDERVAGDPGRVVGREERNGGRDV